MRNEQSISGSVETKLPALLEEKRRPTSAWGIVRLLFLCALALAIVLAALLRWGGYLLVSDQALPSRVDGAVVLQGSILGEKARIAGAVLLVQRGAAAKILVSVPKESYWGQAIAPIAYAYNEKIYGQEIAGHFVFCETDDNVDSTEQESKVLFDCIQAQGWHSVAIVTSDYHTRRAGIVWRRMLREQHSSLQLCVHAVPDPEFRISEWWRDRRSAKNWLLECTKLLWTLVGR
ncbi:MAG TPA: ElyC/SanA/YdcF family protein [Candidatus Sulfotelmatobacter sp.]|nr:ElyC/SanA/YdcF family protein [Candidatus Sulfotelmatobacter sp.]